MFGFFDATVIEQMMKNNRAHTSVPKVPDVDFNTYFNRRYLEEIKPFTDSPSFSMKYFMAMNYVRQNVLETCKKEYITKYNLNPNYFDNHKININNYDEIKDNTKLNETNFDTVNDDDTNTNTGLRRSQRLKNKNN